jgi:hypothetical protein
MSKLGVAAAKHVLAEPIQPGYAGRALRAPSNRTGGLPVAFGWKTLCLFGDLALLMDRICAISPEPMCGRRESQLDLDGWILRQDF